MGYDSMWVVSNVFGEPAAFIFAVSYWPGHGCISSHLSVHNLNLSVVVLELS